MVPLTKDIMQVTIVDDSNSEKCEAHCGVDWSSKEAITLACGRIRDRFGDNIQLEYLDLSKPIADHHALELVQGIENGNLSLPLLLINGEPRIAGQFDFRLLLDAINTEVELNYE